MEENEMESSGVVNIPEKYWNRIYSWEGGGYDGCLWEPNNGIVSKDGHWHPLFSTGYAGMDVDGWLDRRKRELREDLGYSESDLPARQFDDALREAIVSVFGHYVPTLSKDKRVVSAVSKERERFDKYMAGIKAIKEEKTRRLDEMFMDVISGEARRDGFQEVGSLDGDSIKETCGKLSSMYKHTVGLLVTTLDMLLDLGYEPWCKCSDCGEMFTLDYHERFEHLLDTESYVGNGGLGVLFNRILCEKCEECTRCPSCNHMNLPNTRAADIWADNFGFLGSLMHDWIGVCDACASNFEYELTQEAKDRLDEIEGDLSEKFNKRGYELYKEASKDDYGIKLINEFRDLAADVAKKEFGYSVCDIRVFGERI